MTSAQPGHAQGNPPQKQTGLVRAIGRWSLAALALNSIIGSGIFGLPSTVAKLLGPRSVVAVLIAGAAMAVIMACFAEVASQFSETGGPYLYARTAFGRLTGILVGWMLYLAQTAAPAANANLFVIYLAQFCGQQRIYHREDPAAADGDLSRSRAHPLSPRSVEYARTHAGRLVDEGVSAAHLRLWRL
jgi:amino acid transporter